MPVSIPYTVTQSVDSISLTFTLPFSSSSSLSSLDVLVTPLLVKVSAPPCLLLVDLLRDVLPDSRRLRRLEGGQAVLELRKREEGDWPALLWSGDKAAREARRRQSLQQWEEEQRSAAAAAKERRKTERKEDRERGWEAEKQRQQAIDTLKTRERVVAVEELQAWSSSRRHEGGEEKQQQAERWEEEKTQQQQQQPAPAAALPRSSLTPPASPPLPPVRSAVRLTASFTSVHPSLPSLPARCPLPAEPAPAASLSASLLPSVLALKERADSCYGKRELLSALSGYSSALEALRGLRQEKGGDEERRRQRLLEGKLLSNRSACWWERSKRAAGVEAMRKAEQDALEAMSLLHACTQHAGKEAGDPGQERETEEEAEREQLLRKLSRRLAAVYCAMGRWDDALQRMTDDDGGREEATRNAEAVRAGEDRRETQEALRCLHYRPPLLGPALRYLSSALALRPLSLQALELRLSVCVLLRRWTEGLRDAATALSLCDADGELEEGQKVRLIARRGECLHALMRHAEAKADFALALATPAALTPSASSGFCPPALSPSATALSALLAAADTEAELAAVTVSIRSLFSSLPAVPCPAAASSSPAAPLAVLAAHFRTVLRLHSQLQPPRADERWLLSRCELVSDAAWLSCIDGSTAAAERQRGREGLQRAMGLWQQWKEDSRQQQEEQQEQEADWPQDAEDAEAREERERRAGDVEAARSALRARESRWLLLCTVRLSTVCCWQGELQRGRDGYLQVLSMLKAATAGRQESEQESRQREQVEADINSIDRCIAAAAAAAAAATAKGAQQAAVAELSH
jgi:hypothetical protein